MSLNDFNTAVNAKGNLYKNKYNDYKKTFLQNIVDLDKAGHIFTTSQFNKFVTAVTYNKSNSFLNALDVKTTALIMNIMLKNNKPTAKQIDLIIDASCGHGSYLYFLDSNIELQNHQILTMFTYGYQLNDTDKLYGIVNNFSNDDKVKLFYCILTFRINRRKNFSDFELDYFKSNIVFPDNFLSEMFAKVCAVLRYSSDINFYLNYFSVLLGKKYKYDNAFVDNLMKYHNDQVLLFFTENLIALNEYFVIKSTVIDEYYPLYFNAVYGFKLNTNIMNHSLCAYQRLNRNDIFANVVNCQFSRSKSIYDNFKILKIEPDYDTFRISIQKPYFDIFEECLATNKFKVTEKELMLCLDRDIKMMELILGYKFLPSQETVITFVNDNQIYNCEKIELLIKYGFQITMDVVEALIKKNLELDNLERFNIEYDEKLYYLCYIHNCDKYKKKFKIDANKLKLREMCNSTCYGFEHIKQFIESTNTQLDRYCMDYLCFKNPTVFAQVYKFYNCKPTKGTYFFHITTGNLRIKYCEYALHHGITQEYMESFPN